MKIGIDARLYGAQKNRGLGRYLEKLLTHLQTIDTVNDYVIFLQPDNFADVKITANNFHKVKVNIPWYTWREQTVWPWILRSYKFDLFHFPHFNVPFFYCRAYVVTIHDLIMTHYTGDRSTTKNKIIYQIKIKIARHLVRLAARRAEAIFCPSEFTKQDIVQKLEIVPDKCVVTYEAVDKMNFSSSGNNFVSRPYFLYVGAAYPHKNLETMINGFLEFNQTKKYDLVLAGRFDYFYKKLKEKNKNQPEIIFLGEVSDNRLAILYQHAQGFIFPSLVEGFGLPPLEAMSQGCVVIASRASCLPEVLGEAVLYFSPDNSSQLADCLNQLQSDQNLRAKLLSLGFKQTAKYSWSRMAEQTKLVFDEILLKVKNVV